MSPYHSYSPALTPKQTPAARREGGSSNFRGQGFGRNRLVRAIEESYESSDEEAYESSDEESYESSDEESHEPSGQRIVVHNHFHHNPFHQPNAPGVRALGHQRKRDRVRVIAQPTQSSRSKRMLTGTQLLRFLKVIAKDGLKSFGVKMVEEFLKGLMK